MARTNTEIEIIRELLEPELVEDAARLCKEAGLSIELTKLVLEVVA